MSKLLRRLDFVTATRTDADARNDIAVANLSLSGPRNERRDGDCASTRLQMHLAVCRAVKAGGVMRREPRDRRGGRQRRLPDGGRHYGWLVRAGRY
jgi:hypothetical protein